MQFTTLVASILAASLASASPIAQPTVAVEATNAVELEARGVQPLIDLWDDKAFLGLKFTGSANVGDCKNLPNDFNDLISSGKAKPGFRCTVWVDKDCQGTGFSFNADPGVSLLPNWINNKSSSWKCVKA